MISKALVFILLSTGQVGDDWQSSYTPHFKVMYMPASKELADSVIPVLEPELLRISGALQAALPPEITVVVTPNQRTFIEMQGGEVPPWVSGMAYPSRRLIVLRPLYGYEVRHSNEGSVVSHEIAHVVLEHRIAGGFAPRWIEEGVAVYMGREPLFVRTERLYPVAISGRYIPFEDLELDFPGREDVSATAYAQSGDFVRFLIEDKGMDQFQVFLDLVAAREPWQKALETAYGASLEELEKEWLSRVRRVYGVIALLTGGGFFWFLIALLFLAAYMVKSKRTKLKRQLMEMEEGGLGGPDYSVEVMDRSGWSGRHDDYYEDEEDLDEDGEYPYDDEDDEDDDDGRGGFRH